VAALSAKELLCKDFASEPDEASLRTAGDAMVKSLAGNLALVTSKEPVRNSLLENVHAELLHHGMPAVSFPFVEAFVVYYIKILISSHRLTPRRLP